MSSDIVTISLCPSTLLAVCSLPLYQTSHVTWRRISVVKTLIMHPAVAFSLPDSTVLQSTTSQIPSACQFRTTVALIKCKLNKFQNLPSRKHTCHATCDTHFSVLQIYSLLLLSSPTERSDDTHFVVSWDIPVAINLQVYFYFPSCHTQLTVEGKIGYMFRLEQVIIGPLTIILKKKN
jgi:hypothetical protein